MTVLVVVAMFTAAADDKSVVVLTPTATSASDEQLIADVARELQLGGFTVTRATTAVTDEDGLRAALVSSTKEHRAVGGVRLSPTRSQISVEVWGQHKEVRKLRRRDFPAVGADERRVVALRAVELLRAVLLEVTIEAEAPPPEPPVTPQPIVDETPKPEPKPTPPTMTVETLPDPPPPDVTRARVWRLGLGAGADKLGSAEPVPAASLSAGVLLGDTWLAELDLRGDVLPATAERATAKAGIRAFAATIGIGPLWRSDPWELGVLANAGIAALDVRGDAPPPLVVHDTTRVRPTASGSLRATYWFGENLWMRLNAQVGWVQPLDVYVGSFPVAEVGPLRYGGELALGVAFDD